MATRISIVGAGPGGYVSAIRAAQLGGKVTLIEKDNVGGTCLNRGCIPSKVMITTAELLKKISRSAEFGIDIDGRVQLNMNKLIKRKNKVIQDETKGIHGLLNHHQVKYMRGSAFIEEPGVLKVRQPEKTCEIKWDKLIIATGTKPASIPGFPFDGERIISSDDALNIKTVPETILIIGGGVIGCEFAFMLSAFGSKVTVVEALDRLLPIPSVDEDCSKILQREMKKQKIKFTVNRSVESFKIKDEALQVVIGSSPFSRKASDTPPEKTVLDFEKVLVCIGRKPNTDHIGLENIGVKMDEKGWIQADDRMRTSCKNVYAIGDVLGPSKIMLAHVASHEGMVAADNAAGQNQEMDYNIVPGAIFTTPEIANVGITEKDAKKGGYEVRSDTVLFRRIGKAHVLGEIAGQVKIVSDLITGRILGVHMVGPHVTELIAQGTLAIKKNMNVKELGQTIHAHPTLSEIMLETSLKSLEKPLHG